MIANDQELEATLDRIRQFQSQLAHLRKTELASQLQRASASGFIAGIGRVQLEIREYLSLHPSRALD